MTMQHEPLPERGKKFDRHMSAADPKNGPSPRLIAALLLAGVIVVFIIANGHATRIDFVLFKWDTTVRWSIFIAIVLGIVLDRLVGWGMRRRKAAADEQNDAG